MNSQILVELQESMGSDLSIANAAWTSTYDKSKREGKYDDQSKVASLVERLAKDGHGTPFESVIFRFWIRMPIFADRQHMTHRMASHNGLSGRYRTMTDDFYEVPRDVQAILTQAYTDRHSIDISESYAQHCRWSVEWYQSEIEALKGKEKDKIITNEEFKRCREVLRGVLPQSNMIERTTIMNLRSFANYQKQRNSAHAQPEIRQVAAGMLKAVENANICPTAINALKEKGWVI